MTWNAPTLITLVVGVGMGVATWLIMNEMAKASRAGETARRPPPRPWLIDRVGYDWVPVESLAGNEYIRIADPTTAQVWTIEQIDRNVGISGQTVRAVAVEAESTDQQPHGDSRVTDQ